LDGGNTRLLCRSRIKLHIFINFQLCEFSKFFRKCILWSNTTVIVSFWVGHSQCKPLQVCWRMRM
ncbi:hypothetical protein L9F63_012999, partial [Diploptera punctata]